MTDQQQNPIKRALISVSNKQNIVEFARELTQLDIEIVSTGGTSKLLKEAHIPVLDVSDVTGFPEMMDGRLKTLHPKIHGGILGQRDVHAEIAKQYDITWIDLVVVNLYPFAETIKKPDVTFTEAIENIDIGGPTMIRAAAKNMEWVGVVVDPVDYERVLEELRQQKNLAVQTRKYLATKAFAHTASYDALINRYLSDSLDIRRPAACPRDPGIEENLLDPTDKLWADVKDLRLEKFADLRYGENPHQKASAYYFPELSSGVLSAKQHQGKQLSYNNIADADAAVACVREFSEPACVIVKHANPCGAAVANDARNAFQQAFNADSQSAFGGIVALNQTCTEDVAAEITKIFMEVVIAPSYTNEALALLAQKANLRVLEMNVRKQPDCSHEYKFITGGVLVQDRDVHELSLQDLTVVTETKPTQNDLQTMLFAWQVIKHIKSNAILIAKDKVTLGVGAGQVSRVDAVDIALRKAGQGLVGAVLASDAFFPFRDSIDRLAGSGIRAIIQPGGSVRDSEVIAACNEHGIAMVFTGMRCFKH